jgi:protein ImuA
VGGNRRLHLAVQSSEALLVMVRLMTTTQDASPATLRLALTPASDGLMVDIVKRRGPTLAEPLSISLQPHRVFFRGREGLPVVHFPRTPMSNIQGRTRQAR